jgi:hypothetical protein
MIKLIQDCYILVDNGSECGDGCCWNTWWESEKFISGEEIDDENWKINICNLTEGEDYVRID